MLKLLLDEQISRDVATGFQKRNKNVPIAAVTVFENGRLAMSSDEELLTEAARLKFTLVTYDLRTIPPLLKSWSEQSRSHAGVIFIDDKTIPPADFGSLIRALLKVASHQTRTQWTNRVLFLTK
jgi:hypothetical protein